MFSTTRGQSETVGVTLLIGVVVTVTLIFTAVIVFDDSGPSTDDPLADIQITANEQNLTLTHNGGSDLDSENVDVSLRGDNESRRFLVDTTNLSGTDGVFGVGDVFDREHGIDSATMRVLVVHTESNSVLAERTVTLAESGTNEQLPFGLIWGTEADWDSATPADDSLVHAGVGDHRATRIQLGHPPDADGIVAYWTLDASAGAGTAPDGSPFDNEATVVNATAGETGVFGTTSYRFDGNSSVLNVSNSSSLHSVTTEDAISASAWVNTDVNGQNAHLFSQFDGLTATTGGDVLFGLEDGSPGLLLDEDGAIEANVTTASESEWREGSFTNTTTLDGQLRLDRTEGVAHGQFEAPQSAEDLEVTTGFEPDLITFRTVTTGRSFNETANVGGEQFGSGQGFAACGPSDCDERALAFGSGSDSPDGRVAGSRGGYSVYGIVPTQDDGTGAPERLLGSVSATDAQGFTVTFDEAVSQGPQVQVVYSAYALPPGAEVEVDHFQTRNASGPNPGGRQHVETGFEPNYVQLLTGPTVEGLGQEEQTADSEPSEIGFSRGWSINNESRDLSLDVTDVGETGTFNQTVTATQRVLGESGRVTAPTDAGWATVNFDDSYIDPVIVATVNSEAEADHALFTDVQNVDANSAEIRVCEDQTTDDTCDPHGSTEEVGYVVINASMTSRIDGIEAGTFSISQGIDSNTTTESYSEGFTTAPVVFTTVQTTNDDTQQPVEARVIGRSTGGFTAGICHLDSNDDCDTSRAEEEVGWVAIEPGTDVFNEDLEVGQTGDTVTDSQWDTESFSTTYSSAPAVVVSTQTDDGGQEVQVDEARSVTTTDAEVRYCEIPRENQGTPDCDTHTGENVGWLAAPQDTTLTATNRRNDWVEVSFNSSYGNPVVVGSTNTKNESGNALTFDARNVGSDDAEMRVCDTRGSTNGCEIHGNETVGYVVIDAAATDDVPGIDAGTVSRSGGIDDASRESFAQEFGSAPVVLANVQTTNGEQPVETRVTSRDADGFSVGICHQGGTDNCDSGHGSETVGWVAIASGATPFDQRAEAGATGTVVNSSRWNREWFETDFQERPVVVASTVTENEDQELQIDEVRNVTRDSAEVRYCEIEGDPDSCDTHTDENVAWAAFQPGSNLTIATQPVREQIVMSQSGHADDINYHAAAANDSEIVHTLFTDKSSGDVTGRVRATLRDYNGTGFTLDYQENSPDAQEGDQFVSIYAAVRLPDGHPEIGYATTPTSTGQQNLSITQPVTDLAVTASNTIPGMNREVTSGVNQGDNHFGWMFGAGRTNGSTGVSVGLSSHSNSVNGHATGSRTDPFYLLYSDQNGNVVGRDRANITGASAENVTLDWERIATGGGGVAYDSVVYVYQSFGLQSSFPANGTWESPTIDAGKPVYWNDTRLDSSTPAATSVDVNYTANGTTYDSIEDVPRTARIQYDVALTGDGDTGPQVNWLDTSYRAQALNLTWTSDTSDEFQGGTTDNATIDDGNVTLAANTTLGEAGTVEVTDGNWETITFRTSYTNPVVVGTTNTRNSGESALTFDASNVTSTSADVRVCETEGDAGGCDTHTTETVGYVVIDAAATDVEGIDAGTVNRSGGIDDRDIETFDEDFGSNPIVLANVQTTDGTEPVETRVTDRSTDQFTVGICHQGGTDSCDSGHGEETVGWVALEPTNLPFVQSAEVGTTGTVVSDSDWEQVDIDSLTTFDSTPVVVASTMTENGDQELQIDEARSVTSTDAEVRYCEIEDSGNPDTCDGHTSENVGWFAVESGPLIGSYQSGGRYNSTVLDAGRPVNWTNVVVDAQTGPDTSLDVDYFDGGTIYESLGDVPDSRYLAFNATLSSTSDESLPLLDNVTVEYEKTGWRSTNRTVTDGNWHHVAATYDGSTVDLYVDGDRRRSVSGGFGSITESDARRQIGGDATDGRHYDGRLDALRIYNRSLSEGEVRSLYNATTNGTVVTLRKSFRTDVEPDTVRVTNVSASVPSGSSLEVVVESDPNGDGTYEEASDPISLDGSSGPFPTDGLVSPSSTFRLRLTFESTDPTVSATLDEIVLSGDV